MCGKRPVLPVVLALLGAFAFAAHANDLVLTFKVVDCTDRGVAGVDVLLEGCVDPIDNNNQPFISTTDANGVATFGSPPEVVQYCFGSANGFCKWTATKNGKIYEATVKTLRNLTASGYVDVTAREASGCRCDGTDFCNPVISYDADQATPAIDPIILKETNCPGTPPPPPPPPPEECPTTCQFEVKVRRGGDMWNPSSGNYMTEKIEGICSGKLKLTERCGEKPENICPRGYINSRQPCKSGKDCGVCCVAQTSLCAAKTNGKCAKNGGQCLCRETKYGATCKSLTFPAIIKHWRKKNKNPKCDAFGNMLDNWGRRIDWYSWKGVKGYHNWNTHDRKLKTFDWSDWLDDVFGNGGGCEENLCNAVAAKGGFSAACCPFGCDD